MKYAPYNVHPTYNPTSIYGTFSLQGCIVKDVLSRVYCNLPRILPWVKGFRNYSKRGWAYFPFFWYFTQK